MIARSTFILWERRLASGDDGSTPPCAAEWFVEVEDDGDEAPPPRGSGLFAELTDAGALVTDPDSCGGLEDGCGWRSCAHASPARANGSWRSATYLVDVLQRVGEHPSARAVELTPRIWKTLFADDPLRSDLDRARDPPTR